MRLISRFWTSIRNQDWGTAAVDVVVVAVGIWMALAVDERLSDEECAVVANSHIPPDPAGRELLTIDELISTGDIE